MTADETTNVEEIGVGDIGAIMGCEHFRSGDTIIEEGDDELVVLDGVSIPPPVFFCSIEPIYSRDLQQLEKVLKHLSYEDPSLTVKESKETGQIQVSGMGELHLEILKDRIKIDYGLESEVGPMKVAYRESVGKLCENNFKLEKVIGNHWQYAELTLSIEPDESLDEIHGTNEDNAEFKIGNLSSKTQADSSTEFTKKGQNKIYLDYLKLEKSSEKQKTEDLHIKLKRSQRSEEYEFLRSLESAPKEYLDIIEETIKEALEGGVLLGYPIINTKIRIVDGRWSNIRSDEQSFKEATSKCMQELLRKSSNRLLEPFMKTEIEIPNSCLGDVLSSVSGKKNGKVISINNVKAKFTDDIGKSFI